jgi:hypothetical protein
MRKQRNWVYINLLGRTIDIYQTNNPHLYSGVVWDGTRRIGYLLKLRSVVVLICYRPGPVKTNSAPRKTE